MLPLDLLYGAALPLAWLAWRLKGKHRTDWRARRGHGAALPAPGGVRILVHGVSVGEVNASRPLVAALRARGVEVVVAATTDTGFARAEQVYGPQGIAVLRYPFDLSAAVGRLLDRVRPSAVVAMELEVWPHITLACRARRIPFVVANGRLSPRSFKGYRRLRPLLRPMFSRVGLVLAQNEDYAARFRAMGAPRVEVAGSLKWDAARIEDPAAVAGAAELAQALGLDRGRPLVVAGSTGPGEEALLVRALAAWPAGTQLLLAPRKPERFDEAHAACPPGTPRRSRHPQGAPAAAGASPVVLLDTLGELRQAYALADVVVVGRSFLGLHGSDVFEPAGLGKPTLIGPHHGDFTDAVRALAAGGGLRVAADPGPAVAALLADRTTAAELGRRGQEVIRAHQGVGERQAQTLLDFLAAQQA